MTSIENDINGKKRLMDTMEDTHGRRPLWNTTSMEDKLNERQTQLKTNSIENKWRITSIEDNINGRQPQWKITSMEDNLNGR